MHGVAAQALAPLLRTLGCEVGAAYAAEFFNSARPRVRLKIPTEMLAKEPPKMNTLKYLAAIAVLGLAVTPSANALMLQEIGGGQGAPPTPLDAFNIAKGFKENFTNDQRELVFAGHETITTGLDLPVDVSGFAYAVASFAEGVDIGATTFAVFRIIGDPVPSTVTFPQSDPVSGGGAITEVFLFRTPDGGTTATLLGIAVVGLGFMRRFALRRHFYGV